MYIFRKTGLTIASKVWKEGETLDDAQAERLGIARWFGETDGRKGNEVYIEYVGQKGMSPVQRDEKNEGQMLSSVQPEVVVRQSVNDGEGEIAEILKGAGLSLDKMMKMTWKQLVKQFGISTAAKLRNYQKQSQ